MMMRLQTGPVDVQMQPDTYTEPGLLSWPWSAVWLEEKIMAKIDAQSPNLPANKIVKNKLGVCKNDDGYNLHDGETDRRMETDGDVTHTIGDVGTHDIIGQTK